MPGAMALKRGLDLVVGAAGLAVALPIIALGWVLVVTEDGLPGFFIQRRVGRGDRDFGIPKLRTLRRHSGSVGEVGQVGPEHELVTRVGRWLRRLKIDELPQFLTVVLGDMSLVGPRPTVPEQVAEYDDFARRRLLMRPRLTGWAQVHGNASLPWADRIRLDVWYVDHWSLGLDLVVLARTIDTVLLGERPNAEVLTKATTHEIRTRRRG